MGRTIPTTLGLVLLLLVACGEQSTEGAGGGDTGDPVVVLARDDGWRDGLMDAVGHRYLVAEVAFGAEDAQQAWEDNVPDEHPNRSGPPDMPGVYMALEEVDLDTHAVVVVSSGTSSSCPSWPDDVRVRAGRVELHLVSDTETDRPCTDDLAPYRAVLAVERDRLPPADELPIEEIDVPSENLTGVDGIMTAYPAR